jgi:DNA helicase-2/ATP-dependent DNA helicase PcrA
MDIPKLEGDALAAVMHDGSHMQIIAGAGSGKTETVSQRVARLVAEGVLPEHIVAFTFTEKAAKELKERIRERVLARAGAEAADRLGLMYVGTIHGFCFQLLSRHISEYESYSVMDENKFTAFLVRYSTDLQLKKFDSNGGLYRGIERFRENLEVVENELLQLDSLPPDFAETVSALYSLLDQHRLLTFGLQIARAVEVLQSDEVRARIVPSIRHLIVDEYQDVNPAQEELIKLLAKPVGGAELVVVGDDDQAIYQWRGSSVENITTFSSRYEGVTKFELLQNRRSRPEIVAVADAFAKTIPGRLDKGITPFRSEFGPAVDITFDHDIERTEALEVARSINRLHANGFAYRDMAVLVRGRTAYPALLDAFESERVPVNPGDRKALFEQEDAEFLGRVFIWFAGLQWRVGRFNPTFETVELADLSALAKRIYGLSSSELTVLEKLLVKLKGFVGKDSRQVSMVFIAYSIVGALGVGSWDSTEVYLASRLGTIAKFITFIADYEGANKQSRVLNDSEGGQKGASNQGDWYFKNLATLMTNYALGEYRDFGIEDELDLDAIDLMTVHAAKGLEWPLVFLPSLTKNRFPSNKFGRQKSWIIPRTMFVPERYEGTEADERRLFYVALTRARDWVSLSTHEKVSKQKSKPSPFIEEVSEIHDGRRSDPAMEKQSSAKNSDLLISYSEIASYLTCGFGYWLRNRIGFPPEIVGEIGYGNAVHHLMRVISEESTRTGQPVTMADVDRIMATDFFLPYANKAAAAQMADRAKRIVSTYIDKYPDELTRLWEAERPFELTLDGALISGRADVVLDMHEGVIDNLALVDYKTSVGEQDFALQLQVYAEAGIREGLNVRGAFVHDLRGDKRADVDISESARTAALGTVQGAVDGIKRRHFVANPSESNCMHCDVRALCKSRAVGPKPIRIPRDVEFS